MRKSKRNQKTLSSSTTKTIKRKLLFFFIFLIRNMLCSPEDAEKTLLVLNCRKDLSLILLDHFLGAFSIFIFASVVSDLLKWYFRLVRKRCLPAKKEPEDSLLSNRFHAPILNSKQKYRGTGRVVLPRLLFAQIRREGRRDTDS